MSILPKHGALKYAYLPENIKTVIDDTTKNILALLPALQGQIDRYVRSVIGLETKFESKPEDMKPLPDELPEDFSKRVDTRRDHFAQVEKEAREDAELRVKNAILKASKSILRKRNQKSRQVRTLKFAVNTLVSELFNMFSSEAQENENTLNFPHPASLSRDMTTAALHDWMATHEKEGSEMK